MIIFPAFYFPCFHFNKTVHSHSHILQCFLWKNSSICFPNYLYIFSSWLAVAFNAWNHLFGFVSSCTCVVCILIWKGLWIFLCDAWNGIEPSFVNQEMCKNNINQKVPLGKNHQWMIKPVDARFLGYRIFTFYSRTTL